MSDTEVMKRAIAAIEGSLDVVKSEIAELDGLVNDQALASDRNAWQASVGALLTLIERHGNAELTAASVRIVNTNPYTGSHTGEPRADIAMMNIEAVIERAIAAQLVVRRPVIDPSGDLAAAIATLEADVGDPNVTPRDEADAMRVVVSYAQLAGKMLGQ